MKLGMKLRRFALALVFLVGWEMYELGRVRGALDVLEALGRGAMHLPPLGPIV